MKITKKSLNAIGIHNSHNIATTTEEKLFVGYYPQQTGRASSFAKWQVIGIKIKTDPNAAWYDHYNKTFDVYQREDKELKLQEAIQWVKDTYNLEISERDVWGDWHIKGTMDKLSKIVGG